MKKIFLTILFFSPLAIHSCPTCVAKVTPNTIPFFAEGFYQPGKKSNASINTEQYGKKELQKLIDSHKEKK